MSASECGTDTGHWEVVIVYSDPRVALDMAIHWLRGFAMDHRDVWVSVNGRTVAVRRRGPAPAATLRLPGGALGEFDELMATLEAPPKREGVSR